MKNLLEDVLGFSYSDLMIFVLCATLWASDVLASDKKIEWSGEVRVRHVQSKESANETRDFNRVRVRLGVQGEVNESVKAVARFSTATSAISGNQTFGERSEPGMARREFGLDRGFIDLTLAHNLSVWGGRTPVPYWTPARSQLILDADLAFEGASVRWMPKWSDSEMFLILGSSVISENYEAGVNMTDANLVGLQSGFTWKGDRWTLTVHLAHHVFTNLKDAKMSRVLSSASVDNETAPYRFRGNSVYKVGSDYYFSNDYKLLQSGVEARLNALGGEWTMFFDGVRNLEVRSLHSGLETGLAFRREKIWAGVAYISKQADAVVGVFSDSNSNGGGTDSVGTRLWLGYKISPAFQTQIQHFMARKGIDSSDRQFTATYFDLTAEF